MTGHLVHLTSPARRDHAAALIRSAPDGYICEVRPGARTLDQNAKFWALMTDISKAKPDDRKHTPEVWKCLFMQAAGYATQFVEGLDGMPFPVGFKSSRLTKAQMSDLIEMAQEYCARYGVELSE